MSVKKGRCGAGGVRVGRHGASRCRRGLGGRRLCEARHRALQALALTTSELSAAPGTVMLWRWAVGKSTPLSALALVDARFQCRPGQTGCSYENALRAGAFSASRRGGEPLSSSIRCSSGRAMATPAVAVFAAIGKSEEGKRTLDVVDPDCAGCVSGRVLDSSMTRESSAEEEALLAGPPLRLAVCSIPREALASVGRSPGSRPNPPFGCQRRGGASSSSSSICCSSARRMAESMMERFADIEEETLAVRMDAAGGMRASWA